MSQEGQERDRRACQLPPIREFFRTEFRQAIPSRSGSGSISSSVSASPFSPLYTLPEPPIGSGSDTWPAVAQVLPPRQFRHSLNYSRDTPPHAPSPGLTNFSLAPRSSRPSPEGYSSTPFAEPTVSIPSPSTSTAPSTPAPVFHRLQLMQSGLVINATSADPRGLSRIENQHRVDIGAASSSSSSRHTCTICGRQFDRPSTLATHMNAHTKNKPFECPICGLGFGARSNMHRHERRCRAREEKKTYRQTPSEASGSPSPSPSSQSSSS